MFLEEREFYGPLPEQVERMVRGYFYHYKDDEDWEVLHVEKEFVAPMGNTDGDLFTFKPDLVVREKSTGLIGCVDHKTTKSIPSAEYRMSDLQSTLYVWGLRQVGIPIDFFTFNYIRSKDPTVPSINQNGSISRRRIDTDYYTLASFLKDYYADSWPDIPKEWKVRLRTLKQNSSFLKRTRITKPEKMTNQMLLELDFTMQEMEAYHELHNDGTDAWVRTLLKSCEWDCDFQDLCLTELMGSDSTRLRKAKYQGSKYGKERGIGPQG
jgi:hypothetical protein